MFVCLHLRMVLQSVEYIIIVVLFSLFVYTRFKTTKTKQVDLDPRHAHLFFRLKILIFVICIFLNFEPKKCGINEFMKSFPPEFFHGVCRNYIENSTRFAH